MTAAALWREKFLAMSRGPSRYTSEEFQAKLNAGNQLVRAEVDAWKKMLRDIEDEAIDAKHSEKDDIYLFADYSLMTVTVDDKGRMIVSVCDHYQPKGNAAQA